MFSALHQPARSHTNVPVLHILIHFSCATRPFSSNDCQTNALRPCSKLFLSLFVFLTPYLEYKPEEGRKGLSETSCDTCDLLWLAGTQVPAGHRTLPVLGTVLMLRGAMCQPVRGVLFPHFLTGEGWFPPSVMGRAAKVQADYRGKAQKKPCKCLELNPDPQGPAMPLSPQHVPSPPSSQGKPKKHTFPLPKVCRFTLFKDLPLNGKILAHNYAVFSLPKHIHGL